MMSRTGLLSWVIGVTLCCSLLTSMSTRADDTEVFVNNTQANVTPNLMFLLDLSGSMEYTPGGYPTYGVEESRLQILQNAVTSLLGDPELPEINIGLATFQQNSGGTLLFPVAPMNSDASNIDPDIAQGSLVKDVIVSIVNSADADGATPTVDQMFEIATYLRGEKPVLGSSSFGNWNTNSQTYEGGWYRSSHPASYSGAVDYVPTGTAGSWTSSCSDYTNYQSGGANYCAGPESAGATLSCDEVVIPPDAGRTCESSATGTCDASCGTRNVCTSGYTYTEPANCLADPVAGTTWVTSTNNGQPTACCTASDASGVECLSSSNYASSCSGPTVQQCNTANHRNATLGGTYQSCSYGRVDNRVYQSPITQQCQKTAIVLLTDGDPSKNTVDYGSTNGSQQALYPYRVRTLIANNDSIVGNSKHDVLCADKSGEFGQPANGYTAPNCLVELADFLHSEEQRPTIAGSTVEVYPIGFGLVGPVADATWGLLTDVAEAGGGSAYVAGNQDELVQAFKSVVSNVTSNNQSFTRLSTSFDVSRLATGNKSYLSLFEPTAKRAWEGNLKGYFLKQGELVDINDNPATELTASGEVAFKPGAQSFWSAIADGNSATAGGFLSTLAPAGRTLYTITDATEKTNVSLADGNHLLDTTNTNLTKAHLGLAASASVSAREDVINWLRSERVGDPLHARPVTVDYGNATGQVVYFMTNQGYIHAIDAREPSAPDGSIAGGDEIFAFMPHELLKNAAIQAADGVGERIYGLDGQITVLKLDANRNGIIEGNDRVILFFNMRRGGGSYFAMDVTEPASPILLWQISAGDAGYEALGQSWSQASLARLDHNGIEKITLVFGGGYDPQHDVLGTTRASAGDALGRGIYLLDALSGNLLMSIGNTTQFGTKAEAMKYSMPADVRTIDTDGNGIIDRLYAVDLGAQIWRVDIAEGASPEVASSYSVSRLADFGADTQGNLSASTQRRFFYAPSVARYLRDGVLQYAISVGSGYRAHPLDTTVTNHVYVLFDADVATGPPANQVVSATLNSLYDATADLVSSADDAIAETARTALASKQGWYIALATGEKVLSRVRIFRNRLLFNAFRPIGNGTTCGAVSTSNRFFALKVGNARGLLPTYVNNVLVMDEYKRSNEVADQTTIIDEPTIVNYHDNSETAGVGGVAPSSSCSAIYAGSEQQLNLCTAPVKVNWRRN